MNSKLIERKMTIAVVVMTVAALVGVRGVGGKYQVHASSVSNDKIASPIVAPLIEDNTPVIAPLPVAIVEAPKEPARQIRWQDNPNGCNMATQDIWASDFSCHDRPVAKQVVAPVAPNSRTVAPTPAPRTVSGSCVDWIDQSNISDKATAKQLIGKESGCNPLAVNRSSGACGIPQALPCSKLGPVNADGTSAVDPVSQMNWMQSYVMSRYGSWSSAMSFWHCIGQCQSKFGTVRKTTTWY